MMQFYKSGFYLLLFILVGGAGYWLWNRNSEKQVVLQRESQIGMIVNEKNGLLKLYDSALTRLDSITTYNYQLLTILKRNEPGSEMVIVLTAPQERMRRLIDSTNLLRDSINIMGDETVNLLAIRTLDPQQRANLKSTFAVLGNLSLTLNFKLDNQRLAMIRDNAASLKTLVGSFDKKIEKLNKFSKLLDKFSKYLGIAIDVFSAAISQGIITPKTTPLNVK
jgi:hypothetical protein